MPTKEWFQKQNADDLADLGTIEGDDILEAAGRKRQKDGEWSQADIDWLWAKLRASSPRVPPLPAR
jgi:hypothetical protein